MRRNLLRYLGLLLAQTLCALIILYYVQAIFRVLIENIGIRQAMPNTELAQVAAAAVIGQICYWTRLRGAPVPTGYRHLFLGHLFAFAGRINFIFGGALFSVYFLRHLPAIGLATLDIGFAFRAIGLIAVLFVLYCYALELERLGAALQAPAAGDDRG